MVQYTPASDKIVHSVSVDFKRRSVNEQIHVVQYDNSIPIIAVSLFSDYIPYRIPANAEGNIRVKKKDGTYVYNPALGCNSDGTVLYFEVTNQITMLPGVLEPIIEIRIGTMVAASGAIKIEVDKNPVQEWDIVSTDEYKTIEHYFDILSQKMINGGLTLYLLSYTEKLGKGQIVDDAVSNSDFLPLMSVGTKAKTVYAITEIGQVVKCEQTIYTTETDEVYTGNWSLTHIKDISFEKYITKPEGGAVNVYLNNNSDVTLSAKDLTNITVHLNESNSISHGYISGLNFETNDETTLAIDNTTDYEVILLKDGLRVTEFSLTGGKIIKLAISCDGLYIYCNVAEI